MEIKIPSAMVIGGVSMDLSDQKKIPVRASYCIYPDMPGGVLSNEQEILFNLDEKESEIVCGIMSAAVARWMKPE